jgi:hypothetical protein
MEMIHEIAKGYIEQGIKTRFLITEANINKKSLYAIVLDYENELCSIIHELLER